jgi:peptidyl-prolyl cis-trans isomerase A (cyclophilin A)
LRLIETRSHRRTATWLSAGLALGLAGCDPAPAEPTPATRVAPKPAGSAPERAPTPPEPTGDPLGGKFALADAIQGLEGQGPLYARITTDKGAIDCELFSDRAPTTVANFVGLARGLRPFKDRSGQWAKKPAYDGTTFHRIIKGFMIQGGDPAGNGSGEPGYTIADEIWEGAKHDRRGQLCMANRGANTNGMQFFITDAAAKHLDGGYTIFGQCGPDSVIEALASVEVRRPKNRPVNPPRIKSIRISRGKPKD